MCGFYSANNKSVKAMMTQLDLKKQNKCNFVQKKNGVNICYFPYYAKPKEWHCAGFREQPEA